MTITRTIRKLKVDYHGKPVAEVVFRSTTKVYRDDIKKAIEKFISNQPGNRKYLVNLPLESCGGWRAGHWFTKDQGVSLFTMAEYYEGPEIIELDATESMDQFRLLIMANPPTAGGCSKNSANSHLNDCLWECIRQAYGSPRRIPAICKTPEMLKKSLDLDRSALVPVTLIPNLEKILNTIAINISGDYSYISPLRNKGRVANIILNQGHYLLAKPKGRKHMGWPSKPKIPLAYRPDGVKGIVHFYDGTNHRTGDFKELYKLQSRIIDSKYCLVIAGHKETLEEAYIRFSKEADALLEATKGFIDLRRFGSYKATALWVFSTLSPCICANEPLSPQEAKWISDAMKGGIIWAEKGWEGEAEQYDYTSMYPSIQIYKDAVQWPIGAGEFRTLTGIDCSRFFRYGIYHATVEGTPKKGQSPCTRTFRYNPEGIYTHHDLERARALGLKITLKNESPNALIYEPSKRISGSIMFGAYIDTLFYHKNSSNEFVKRPAKGILTCLWGALCQRKEESTAIGEGTDYSDTSYSIPEGYDLKTILPLGEKQYLVKTTNLAELFIGEYPRIGPFIQSLGRKLISETVEPLGDKVKRIHTDGFIVEGKGNITTSPNAKKELGALKHEKIGYCKIVNVNKIIWRSD
jgi:hypothetical protein